MRWRTIAFPQALFRYAVGGPDVPSVGESNVHTSVGGLLFPDSTVCISGNDTLYDIKKKDAWHLRKRTKRIGELSQKR